MSVGTRESEDTGLEVIDILSDPQYAGRKPSARDVSSQMAGLQRLAHAFVENPETILQELVNAAVTLCGADSAGISIERDDRTDEHFYHWVATAGEYSGFLAIRVHAAFVWSEVAHSSSVSRNVFSKSSVWTLRW